jgi:hypothetical protein
VNAPRRVTPAFCRVTCRAYACLWSQRPFHSFSLAGAGGETLRKAGNLLYRERSRAARCASREELPSPVLVGLRKTEDKVTQWRPIAEPRGDLASWPRVGSCAAGPTVEVDCTVDTSTVRPVALSADFRARAHVTAAFFCSSSQPRKGGCRAASCAASV